jgi:hypothetical protein
MKIVRLVMTAGLLAVASACDGHLTDSASEKRTPATQVLISTDTVFVIDSTASDTAGIARDGGGAFGSGG